MQAKLLLSTQRSGSHFLKSLIESHFPSVVCSGELLEEKIPSANQGAALAAHPDIPCFWPWYGTEAAAGRISVMPDQRIPAFEKYLALLVSLAQPKDLIIDVKYDAVRTLSGYRDSDFGSADFVSFLRRNEIPVLHLIRRNTLRAVISMHLAVHTGIYHRLQERSTDEVLPRIRIEPKELLSSINHSRQLSQEYHDHFADYPGYAEVIYEGLVEEQHHFKPGPNLRAVARILGRRPVLPNHQPSPFKVTTPGDPSEVVENWDEISRALQDTEHGWMIQNPILAAA